MEKRHSFRRGQQNKYGMIIAFTVILCNVAVVPREAQLKVMREKRVDLNFYMFSTTILSAYAFLYSSQPVRAHGVEGKGTIKSISTFIDNILGRELLATVTLTAVDVDDVLRLVARKKCVIYSFSLAFAWFGMYINKLFLINEQLFIIFISTLNHATCFDNN